MIKLIQAFVWISIILATATIMIPTLKKMSRPVLGFRVVNSETTISDDPM